LVRGGLAIDWFLIKLNNFRGGSSENRSYAFWGIGILVLYFQFMDWLLMNKVQGLDYFFMFRRWCVFLGMREMSLFP
jgi:hypothetical protein